MGMAQSDFGAYILLSKKETGIVAMAWPNRFDPRKSSSLILFAFHAPSRVHPVGRLALQMENWVQLALTKPFELPLCHIFIPTKRSPQLKPADLASVSPKPSDSEEHEKATKLPGGS